MQVKKIKRYNDALKTAKTTINKNGSNVNNITVQNEIKDLQGLYGDNNLSQAKNQVIKIITGLDNLNNNQKKKVAKAVDSATSISQINNEIGNIKNLQNTTDTISGALIMNCQIIMIKTMLIQ